MVAKDGAPVVDITWPPSNEKARFSGLRVSGEVLEKLRPYLESGELKAVIDPSGVFHFSEAVRAFGYIETGRAWGKIVVSSASPPSCGASAACNKRMVMDAQLKEE